MRAMTDKNLHDAYAGESMAHMKYTIWGDQAEREGKPQVARMFRAIAYAERVHATNHWRTLGQIMKSTENLQHAIEGEHYEVTEMYPAFKAVAELEEEKGAIRSTFWALETEKVHEKMYGDAKAAVEAGNDATTEEIWVCPVCGYTGMGEGPDLCPICNAKKSSFKRF